jgi:hypothetical protein
VCVRRLVKLTVKAVTHKQKSRQPQDKKKKTSIEKKERNGGEEM